MSRQSDPSKSFKMAVGSLLTACSEQNPEMHFQTCQQDSLRRLFMQVIISLHENIEDEFESLCLETQVGAALDTVEQLVEERGLDPLFSEKTNIMDVKCDLSTAKKNEIQYLMVMLGRVEEQKRLMQSRTEQLKNGKQDVSRMMDVVEKLRSWISDYGTCNNVLHNP